MGTSLDVVRGYAEDIDTLQTSDPVLATELAGFQGITAVLNWMQRRGLAQTAIDIVGQDEFHYDLLIALEPAGRWLAIGMT
jgi:hypothetical protein